MSTRSLIVFCLMSGIATAGIIITPGGWTLSRRSSVGPSGWTDPLSNNWALVYYGDTNAAGQVRDYGLGDNTGRLHDATCVIIGTNTDVTAHNFGRVHKGFSFNGSSARIGVPRVAGGYSGATSDDGRLFGTSSITVCAWVKIIPNGQHVYALYSTRYGATARGFEVFMASDDQGYCYTHSRTDGFGLARKNVASYAGLTNVWIFVAASITNGSQVVYTNGVTFASTNLALTGFAYDSTMDRVEIGSDPSSGVGDGVYWWNGSMTGIRVYDAVLTPTQVSNVWYWTGGRNGNVPWMSDENGY